MRGPLLAAVIAYHCAPEANRIVKHRGERTDRAPTFGRVGGLLRVPGSAFVLIVWSTAAAGQTLPLPAVPAREPPSTEATGDAADDEAAAGARRPRGWEYALGVGAGWDGNIDVLVPDGPSSYAVIPK